MSVRRRTATVLYADTYGRISCTSATLSCGCVCAVRPAFHTWIRAYLFAPKCPSGTRVAATALLIPHVAQQMSHCCGEGILLPFQSRVSVPAFAHAPTASFADDLVSKANQIGLKDVLLLHVCLVPPVGDVFSSLCLNCSLGSRASVYMSVWAYFLLQKLWYFFLHLLRLHWHHKEARVFGLAVRWGDLPAGLNSGLQLVGV